MLGFASRAITGWMDDEAGASLVEYILLVALVAVVSVAAVTFLGKTARGKFEIAAAPLKS